MASSSYQMTGAVNVGGLIVEVGHNGTNVEVRPPNKRDVILVFDAAAREQFQRLFMEAERRAEEHVSQLGTDEAVKALAEVFPEDIGEGMAQSVRNGHVVAGRNGRGELSFKITEAGKRAVEQMGKEAGNG